MVSINIPDIAPPLALAEQNNKTSGSNDFAGELASTSDKSTLPENTNAPNRSKTSTLYGSASQNSETSLLYVSASQNSKDPLCDPASKNSKAPLYGSASQNSETSLLYGYASQVAIRISHGNICGTCEEFLNKIHITISTCGM
jgi:hypothetical protein